MGNGAAELIKSLMENFTGKTGVIYPTFDEYPNRLPKSTIVPYFPETSSKKYGADDLINYFGSKDISQL